MITSGSEVRDSRIDASNDFIERESNARLYSRQLIPRAEQQV